MQMHSLPVLAALNANWIPPHRLAVHKRLIELTLFVVLCVFDGTHLIREVPVLWCDAWVVDRCGGGREVHVYTRRNYLW